MEDGRVLIAMSFGCARWLRCARGHPPLFWFLRLRRPVVHGGPPPPSPFFTPSLLDPSLARVHGTIEELGTKPTPGRRGKLRLSVPGFSPPLFQGQQWAKAAVGRNHFLLPDVYEDNEMMVDPSSTHGPWTTGTTFRLQHREAPLDRLCRISG